MLVFGGVDGNAVAEVGVGPALRLVDFCVGHGPLLLTVAVIARYTAFEAFISAVVYACSISEWLLWAATDGVNDIIGLDTLVPIRQNVVSFLRANNASDSSKDHTLHFLQINY